MSFESNHGESRELNLRSQSNRIVNEALDLTLNFYISLPLFQNVERKIRN